MTGDTVSILPAGEIYKNEDNLKKVSLASVRSPRVGNERMNKPDEDYARECKERLRLLCAGKTVKVTINYERDIPLGETTERRQFGTISVGKRENLFFESEFIDEIISISFKSEFTFNIDEEFFLILKSTRKRSFPEIFK